MSDYQRALDEAQSYFITERHVKSALDKQLRGTRTQVPNPLEQLMLVDRLVDDPDFPPYRSRRTVALGKILTTFITVEYVRKRRIMDILDNVSDTSSLKEAFEAIQQDVKSGSREVIGWSWLYYHYVRVDLCIDSRLFRQICPMAERTLNHYQTQSLLQLTNMLIEEEWQICR